MRMNWPGRPWPYTRRVRVPAWAAALGLLALAACSAQRDSLDPLVGASATTKGSPSSAYAAQGYVFDDLGVAQVFVCAARGHSLTLTYLPQGGAHPVTKSGPWVQVAPGVTSSQENPAHFKLVSFVFTANVTPVYIKAVGINGHATKARYPAAPADDALTESGCP